MLYNLLLTGVLGVFLGWILLAVEYATQRLVSRRALAVVGSLAAVHSLLLWTNVVWLHELMYRSTTSVQDADFEATIDAHDEPPTDADDLPDASEALVYLDVEHDLDDEQVANATFAFTVTTDELDARDVAPGNVVLYHAVDGQWTERETTVVEEREDAVELRTEVPHFSWFAVASTGPSFEIDDGSLAAADLTVGEETTVDATVVNAGTGAGETDVALTADGETVDVATVTLDAGDRTDVTFEHAFEEPGEYQIAVEGATVETVEVAAAPSGGADESGDETGDEDASGDGDAGTTDEDSDDGAADEDSDDGAADASSDDGGEDDGQPGFGAGLAVATLLTAALLAARRAE